MTRDHYLRQQLSRRGALRLGAGFAGGAALTTKGIMPVLAGQDDPIVVPDFTPVAEPEPVELDLWTFVDTHARWFEEMAEAYRQQVNPDFKLNVVQTAYEDHHNKLLLSIHSGGVGAPCLADIEQGRFGAFSKGDLGLVDLTDRLKDGGYLDLLVASREALYTVNDHIYGVEHALTPVVLYYRSDIFEEAGVETPIETWDDFIAAMKSLVTGDMKGIPIDWAFYDVLLRQRGFDVFDAQCNVTADSAEAIETLEWMLDLRDEHGIAAEPPGGAQAFGTASDQSFYAAVREGEYIAIPGADWYAGFLKDNVSDLAGKWQAQFLPAFEPGGRRTSVLGGTGLTITEACEHKDAAWDFMRYAMLSIEGNVQRYLETKLWPPFQPAWDDPRLYSPDPYFNGQKLGELFAEIGAEAPPQYQCPLRAEFNVLRRDKYTRDIFGGELTPAEGLKRLADEIRELEVEQ